MKTPSFLQKRKEFLASYAVRARNGVFEKVYVRRVKREHREESGERQKRAKRPFLRKKAMLFRAKKARFIDIRARGGNEEDGDVYKIGRFADNAVVRIKNHGDKEKPQENAAKLYAPKALAPAKEEALHSRIN